MTMKCCGFLTNWVELLAAIYGIIGCTLSLGFALIVTVHLVLFIYMIDPYDIVPVTYIYVLFLLFVVAAFVMMFGFAVFLLKGIKQRNEKYVLSYFIFGIVKTVLLLAVCLGLLIRPPEGIAIIGTTMSVVVAYALPLAVVWAAYRSVGRTKNCEMLALT